MINKDFIRFALLMSDNESRDFYVVVSKLVQLVLLNGNEFLSAHEIAKRIKKEYSLSFSEDEILNSINSDENLFNKSKKEKKTVYCLKEQIKNKLSNNSNYHEFDNIVDNFISCNKKEISLLIKDTDREQEFIKNSIVKYLYDAFNTNANDLIRLTSKTNNAFTNDESLSGEDRKIVYLFLKWNNREKNSFVYRLIESSYEYCLLTLKDNNTPFKEMVSSKVFVMDTNVILSLIGVNGEDKKTATLDFFKKCKEFNISIKYTNLSLIESKETLSSLVDYLQTFIDEDKDDLSDSVSSGIFEIANIYNQYVIETGDSKYSSFKKHMLSELADALFDYQILEINENFVRGNSSKINEDFSELKEYKEKRSPKRRKPKSIRHDVINYLNIVNLRPKGCSNLISCKMFFITFDGLLCSWSKEKANGMPCPVISPNIMYSLLLRFSSRTEDDIKSFNDFLGASLLYYYDNERAISSKTAIARAINKVAMSSEMKKRIFVCANAIVDRYAWSSNEDEIDIVKILDESSVSAALELEQEKNATIDSLNLKHEQELKDAKQNATNEANKEWLGRIAREKANRETIIRRIVAISICSIFVVSIVVLTISLFISFRNDNPVFDNIEFYISVGGVAFGIISYLISSLLEKTFRINVNVWSFDTNKIYQKKLNKLHRKYFKEIDNGQ